VTFAVRF